MRYPIALLTLSFLITSNLWGEKILFSTRNFTFPEALNQLKKHIDFTYSLPRTYIGKGAKGNVRYGPTEPEELLRKIISQYSNAHSLFGGFKPDENNHYHFRRSSINRYVKGPTLLEALARLEHYKKLENIELREWTLVYAERKFESSSDYTGNYWHMQYARDNPTDGGIGIHHFFIYEDLLVEHIKDGSQRMTARKSTQEIIDSSKIPSY